jgi:hypothetical protein
LPSKLDGIVVKCLEKDPKDRYPSAAALADDLDAFLAGGATVAPELTPVRRFRRWVSRHSLALAGSVLLVLLAAGLVGAGVAMAPRSGDSKEQPKEDPWLAIERELDTSDGKKGVVFVGAKGMPRYSQWHVSEPQLGLSATKDGTLQVKADFMTFLELARDPRHASYRIIAQVRQESGEDDDSFVGVYLGYEDVIVGAGDTIQPAVGTWHSEFRTHDEKNIRIPLAMRRISLKHLTRRCLVGTNPMLWSHGGGPRLASLFFKPFDERSEMPWRTIVIDVFTDRVEFRLGGSSLNTDGNLIVNLDKNERPVDEPLAVVMTKLVLVDTMTTDAINRERYYLREHVKQYVPGPGFTAIPDWNPRRPIGIWLNNTTISVRNVSITPFLPRANRDA